MKKLLLVALLLIAPSAHSGELEDLYNGILKEADNISGWASKVSRTATIKKYARKVKNSADNQYIWASVSCQNNKYLKNAKKERDKIRGYVKKIRAASGATIYGRGINLSARKIKAKTDKIYSIAKYRACKDRK